MAVDGSGKRRNKAREAGRRQTLEGKIRSSTYGKMGGKILSDGMTASCVLKKTRLW